MSLTWQPETARPKRGPLSDPAPANWYGQASQQHKRIGQTETDDEKRAEWIEEVWRRLEEGRA